MDYYDVYNLFMFAFCAALAGGVIVFAYSL